MHKNTPHITWDGLISVLLHEKAFNGIKTWLFELLESLQRDSNLAGNSKQQKGGNCEHPSVDFDVSALKSLDWKYQEEKKNKVKFEWEFMTGNERWGGKKKEQKKQD